MRKRILSVLLILVMLLSVSTSLAGAITADEMANAAELTLGVEATA